MTSHPTRRRAMGLGAAALAVATLPAASAEPFRLGLTPVFLDNDAAVVEPAARGACRPRWRGRSTFVQRRSLSGGDGAAAGRLGRCGLALRLSVPAARRPAVAGRSAGVARGAALPVLPDRGARRSGDGLVDLRGGSHAFSDPDSNSGWLVTASDLARRGERLDAFFARTIFTCGHRNVVRAVAGGLTRSGSVDGYVWEALARWSRP